MKKAICILLIGMILFSLCSCCLEYDSSNGKTVDGVYYVFNSVRKICFATEYAWDETEKAVTIRIPDEIDGYKVVSLGGFTGSGAPNPFGIRPSSEERACGSIECIPEGTDVEKIPVTIVLGKNVKEIGCSMMDDFLQTENGTYIFLSSFEIDENNKYFEADGNGKLTYSNYSPERIDRFLYQADE